MQHADLVGGEADAERVAHELAHALDLGAQLIVEALDLERAGAQHGVAELAHAAQRGVAARAHLGVELGARLGVLGLLCLEARLLDVCDVLCIVHRVILTGRRGPHPLIAGRRPR